MWVTCFTKVATYKKNNFWTIAVKESNIPFAYMAKDKLIPVIVKSPSSTVS